jgi:hypothetical protein
MFFVLFLYRISAFVTLSLHATFSVPPSADKFGASSVPSPTVTMLQRPKIGQEIEFHDVLLCFWIFFSQYIPQTHTFFQAIPVL